MRAIRNWLVVAIAVVLAATVLLVTDLIPFGQDARFDEDHPFTSIPEFPSADKNDSETLRNAAKTNRESTEWSEVDFPKSSTLSDVAALTRRRVRIGVYAEVDFEVPSPMAGPRGFIR